MVVVMAHVVVMAMVQVVAVQQVRPRRLLAASQQQCWHQYRNLYGDGAPYW